MADTEIEANGTEPVVGDVVMSFRVLERCGAGAYGVGLLCEDLRLPKRRVLVKWGRRADDDMRERFKQQARYELKIVSEYVRKTHEYDEVGPEHRPILVHEFIEGVPLDKWIANKSIGQRLERFAHIVRAMVDLKRVGFPHGDLHTGNVLVSGDRTILFDLSPESFGATYNAAGLRARAQHDDRCLETMFDEMFGEADMKALDGLAARVRTKNLDELLVHTLERRQREALRPRSDHRDVRRAIVEQVTGTLETYERLRVLRHAAITSLFATFRAAVQAIVPSDLLQGPIQASPDLSVLERQDAEGAASESWKFNTFQGFVRLKSARGGGVEVESSRSGFLPPWPKHLLDEGLLGRGYILHTDAYGGRHPPPYTISSAIPKEPFAVPEWRVQVGRKSALLDVDRLIELLKPHLLGQTPTSIEKPVTRMKKKTRKRQTTPKRTVRRSGSR